MSTGDIEIVASKIEILGKCKNILPFEINTEQEVREDLRLEYRFLDLRNEKLHKSILLRSKVLKELRDKMDEMGFYEIQTPASFTSCPIFSFLNSAQFFVLYSFMLFHSLSLFYVYYFIIFIYKNQYAYQKKIFETLLNQMDKKLSKYKEDIEKSKYSINFCNFFY